MVFGTHIRQNILEFVCVSQLSYCSSSGFGWTKSSGPTFGAGFYPTRLSGTAVVRCTRQLPVCTRSPRRCSAQVARRVRKWKLHRAEVCCTETQRQEPWPKRTTCELTDAETMMRSLHSLRIDFKSGWLKSHQMFLKVFMLGDQASQLGSDWLYRFPVHAFRC